MILQSLPTSSGWRLFKIEGQLDFAGSPAVQTALNYVADRDGSNLLIDLEDVKTADDKGVADLVNSVRRILLDNPRRNVAFVARHAWIADALARAEYPVQTTIFHDGEEALNALGAGAVASPAAARAA